jgi:GT2 family glycosyltransferase
VRIVPGRLDHCRMAKIDLVVATVGRTEALARLLSSIRSQSYRDLRVIVVDQNEDRRLDALLPLFEQDFTIVRLESEPGLSRARNVALRVVDAEIVAFPDDDCWYPPQLIDRLVAFLEENADVDGLSVRSTDSAGRPSNIRWDPRPGPIDRFNVWRRASSISVFLRRSVIEAVGKFDEELGAGSGTPWASGEETDYLLRALAGGASLWYEPSLAVHHESPQPAFGAEESRRAHLSGLGQGRVLRRHGYPPWFVAYRVAQLVAGSAMFLLTGRPAKARFYLAMAWGRARGWLRSDETA